MTLTFELDVDSVSAFNAVVGDETRPVNLDDCKVECVAEM